MNRRLFVLVFVLMALVGLWLYGGRQQTAPRCQASDRQAGVAQIALD
jgi:hypothetical protein